MTSSVTSSRPQRLRSLEAVNWKATQSLTVALGDDGMML